MRGPCPNRLRRARSALALLGVVALVGAAPSGDAAAVAPGTDEVARHVRELEARVRAARERLLVLISTPRAPGAMPLHEERELQQLARELPALERELEQWARIEPEPGGASAPGASEGSRSPETPE
jgi:hypothetical protein